MRESKWKGAWGRLLFGRNEKPAPRQPMTRGQQTAWIVGTMIVIAGFAFKYANSHDNSDPYAKCSSIFVGDGSKCRAEVAMERLNAGR